MDRFGAIIFEIKFPISLFNKLITYYIFDIRMGIEHKETDTIKITDIISLQINKQSK